MRHTRPLQSLGVYSLGLLMVIGAVVATRAIIEEATRRRAVRREIARISDEANRLERQRDRLSAILSAGDQPEALEREARLRLGLRKPGETVIVVRSPGSNATVGTAPPAPSERRSNVRKWWRAIFRRGGNDLRQ